MFEDVCYVPQENLAIESWVCILHFLFFLALGKVFLWILLEDYQCLVKVMIIYMLLWIFSAKYDSVLMPCKKQVTTKQIIKMFFQNVWVHFGLPTSIISNRDSQFIEEFWSSLWELMDTKLKKSTSFHPQTGAQK